MMVGSSASFTLSPKLTLGFWGLGFRVWGLGFRVWLAGNGGMEQDMETTIMGYIGTTMSIYSFIPG